MEQQTYVVETQSFGVWRVLALHLNGRCVHLTSSELEAKRMRDELDRAYREGFYHGLLIGHGEKLDKGLAV